MRPRRLAFVALGALLAALPATPRELGRLSLDEGLSQSIVEAIHQDRLGFLWLATEDGLNRWDGARFTVFRNAPGEARSFPYNDLKCLDEDAQGALWVGSFGGGLNRFDPATGRVTSYRNDPADPASLPSDLVRAVRVDRDGRIWAGTQGGGLARLDPRTGRFERFRHDPRDGASLAHDDVRALLVDGRGALWPGRMAAASTGSKQRRAGSSMSPSTVGAARSSSTPSSRTDPGTSGPGRGAEGSSSSTRARGASSLARAERACRARG